MIWMMVKNQPMFQKQVFHQLLEMEKLVLVRVFNKVLFMIGQKLHIYSKMGLFHKNFFKLLTQSNIITFLWDWKKSLMRSIGVTI